MGEGRGEGALKTGRQMHKSQLAMHSPRTFLVRYAIIGLAIALSAGTTLRAADPNKVAVQKILTGLKDPSGVAVQPDGAGDKYEVFVAESGAGRIVKVAANEPSKGTTVITGFAHQTAAAGHSSPAGVQSLLFLDHVRLVATGREADGKPYARLYELADSTVAIAADRAKQNIDLYVDDKDHATKRLATLCIARTEPNERVGDTLIVPRDGDPTGFTMIPVRAGALADAVPVQTAGTNKEFRVGGIAVAKTGHIVIAGVSTTKHDEPAVLVIHQPDQSPRRAAIARRAGKHCHARLRPKIGQPVRGQFPAQRRKSGRRVPNRRSR